MKTNFRFLFVIMLLGGLVAGCKDEGDEEPGKQVSVETGGEVNGIYFPPAGDGDTEWATVSPTDLKWDTDALNEAIAYAKDNRSYNLLILHKGKIVAEHYWLGTNANTLHPVNSIEKSMMAYTLGGLLDEGKIHLDDKVSDYLAAGWSMSPETEGDITLRHLMTMTSGLNKDLEYASRPGEMWRYNHFAYKVLYEVIKEVVGGSARDYISNNLFKKLGMVNYSWSGYDLSVSGRELTRFGLMALAKGSWLGNNLVQDQGYINEMLSTSQEFQPAYGYLWWLNGTDSWYNMDTDSMVDGSLVPTMPDASFIAKGFHDQRIYFVPEYDLVVIRQGEHTGLPEAGEGSFDIEFWERMMRAIKNTSSTGN